MFPNYPLEEPKGGDRVSATTIRNLVKTVKSLDPSVGWGMKISRNANGVMYQLDKSVIQKGVSAKPMPFDASLLEVNGKTATLKIMEGRLFYGVGTTWTVITATGLSENHWEVNVEVSNGTFVGINCTRDENGGTIPVSFTVAEIPAPTPATPWIDTSGLHFYPLLRFVDGTGGYNGPYVFSLTTQPEEEGETAETFYAVQCHHGDVFFSYDETLSPFVADISSGSGGTYSIEPVMGESYGITKVNVVEIAGTASLPASSRIIVHPIFSDSLPSGYTS